MMTSLGEESPEERVSRTARYRKVTKPLLERRRRARINRCLEELKDLMVGAFEVERENISKLEKADILELTVRHLSKMREPKDPRYEMERFQAGFGHCAAEAYNFILSSPGVDSHITQQLIKHLNTQMNDGLSTPVSQPFSSPVPSISPGSSGRSYSPNYQQESRQSSPSISPMEDNGRNQRGWREEPASVPIDRSLTCDVPYHSYSLDKRSSEPMTGLLMTVNQSDGVPRSHSIDNNDRHPAKIPAHESRHHHTVTRESSRTEINPERKSEILKKIREHIMERQHRDPDSVEITRREQYDEYSKKCSGSKYSNISENEHFSQNQNEIINLSNDNVYASMHQMPNSYKVKRQTPERDEAVNLSSLKSNRDEENTQQTSQDKFNKSQLPDSTSSENGLKLKRQSADYKSIHPKKVMIRTPNNIVNEHSVSFDKKNYQNETKGDNKNVESSKNPPSQGRRGYNIDDERYRSSNRLNESNLHRNLPHSANAFHPRYDDRSYKNREYYFNREQYLRDNPHDQDDDMWRPW